MGNKVTKHYGKKAKQKGTKRKKRKRNAKVDKK